MWINQDAWFSLGNFSAESRATYRLNADGNGIYIFVLEGTVDVAGESLDRRDGVAITDSDEIEIEATASRRSPIAPTMRRAFMEAYEEQKRKEGGSETPTSG